MDASRGKQVLLQTTADLQLLLAYCETLNPVGCIAGMCTFVTGKADGHCH